MSKLHIEQVLKIEQMHLDLLLKADPSERTVKSYLERSICLAGKVKEQIIGVIVLLPTRPKTIEIVNVSVVEQEQGKGYGRELIQYALNLAKHYGCKTVEIGTGNSSINQLALYQKCGFRITEIDRDFFLRHYDKKIYENGIQCRDMIRLSQDV
ncbi:GNAT family N-acetyltransferase [Priestia megaterium]|nr:GNAT family N-acetyltransferase [Priestia megaterium]